MSEQPTVRTGYTILYVDRKSESGEIKWPHEPSYILIKGLVEPIVGGLLEHVSVLHNGRRTDMFVDEMGHVGDGGPKPRNEAATTIYRAWSMSQNPTQDPEGLPWIAGTAIIFDRIIWM